MKKKQKKKLLVKFEVFELFKNMIFKLKKKQEYIDWTGEL